MHLRQFLKCLFLGLRFLNVGVFCTAECIYFALIATLLERTDSWTSKQMLYNCMRIIGVCLVFIAVIYQLHFLYTFLTFI